MGHVCAKGVSSGESGTEQARAPHGARPRLRIHRPMCVENGGFGFDTLDVDSRGRCARASVHLPRDGRSNSTGSAHVWNVTIDTSEGLWSPVRSENRTYLTRTRRPFVFRVPGHVPCACVSHGTDETHLVGGLVPAPPRGPRGGVAPRPGCRVDRTAAEQGRVATRCRARVCVCGFLDVRRGQKSIRQSSFDMGEA